jgi:hypothetical protein
MKRIATADAKRARAAILRLGLRWGSCKFIGDSLAQTVPPVFLGDFRNVARCAKGQSAAIPFHKTCPEKLL